ncbi:methyltransferase, UbiE/COQ5 family [Synechococcus sp. PCC 7335]|uniref:class I SAM-dependent methyltransferase n=1 Tax=Synechococcus sp. (strain ATCC 29403 / PCC 7335) TaxID=91464 RepID=UPI00017EB552|nr:class I SAM-dependent methyltransferase [Synechococcus sp. PCC 7335]EDX83611.1 methyltransferase, UbiE/COQ5 family [Synechococcus sp. PCC 7335]
MNFSRLHQLQQRLFAWGMSKANAADNHAIQLTACSGYSNMADLKRSLLANLQGTVLEIGPGAGANLAYYPTDIHWIGVEPNLFMHSYLRQEAQQRGLHHVDIHGGAAESLPVETAAIDTVVSTHVLCSVDHLDTVLQEIQRILKPGGHFIFLEHVAAENGSWTRRIQDKITPFWKTLFDNCHPNRETQKMLVKAGFSSVDYEHFQLNLPVVSPHIVGIATKAPDTTINAPMATTASQLVH